MSAAIDRTIKRAARLPVAVPRRVAEESPAAIEREIVRTRSELAITLDALERKLAARYLVGKGFDMLKDSFGGSETLNRGLETMRANPLPFALIGIGVAWIAASNTGVVERIAQDERVRAAGRRVSSLASDVGNRAGELAAEVANQVGIGGSERPLGHTGNPIINHAGGGTRSGAWVHQVADTAQEAIRSVRDSGEAVLNEAGDRAGRAAEQVTQAFERHPLAIGAIGMIAGALLALLLPRTRAEDELFGGARDELWHEAEEAGEEAVSRVREAAVRAADAAAHAVSETIDPGRAGSVH